MNRAPHPCRLRRAHPRATGLSLVELLISIALGLMVLAGVIVVFANSSAARNELERSSRQIENGRYALELLSNDLRIAGFYGELEVGLLPMPAAMPDPCSTAIADWKAAIPIHLQGYDNGAGAPICIPASLKAGTDIVVVRRVRGCLAGVGACDAPVAGKPYVQVALCSGEVAAQGALPPPTPYPFGLQGTAAFSFHLRDCTTVAGTREYLVNIYFVSTDNGAGQSIPTLKRLELAKSGVALVFTETALVEGIEWLNIEYGVDTDGDGQPDAVTPDPTTYTYAGCTTCTAVNNWSNVVTARINVLARNTEPSPGYVDAKTYALGAQNVAAANDAYRRHVYSALVRVANPAGRRETP